jgi:hypothetical protein
MALKTGVLQAPGAPLPQVHLLISALGLGGRAIMFDPPYMLLFLQTLSTKGWQVDPAR